MRPHSPEIDQCSPSARTANGSSASSPANVWSRRDAGDPPAHEPADRARLVEAHLARGGPQRVGVGRGGAAVAGADVRIGQPRVEVVADHATDLDGAEPRILRRHVTDDVQPLDQLVLRALAEDVGALDVTSAATVPAGTRAVATITQKAAGVVFGLDAAEATFLAADPDVELERLGPEGEWREPPAPVLRATGDARALLARRAHRAELPAAAVGRRDAHRALRARGRGHRRADPRHAQDDARGCARSRRPRCARAAGVNHRAGLYDMVLIKENHAAMAGGVGAAVRAARAAFPDLPLEVECRTRAEVDEALEAGAPRILLDNMRPDELRATAEHVAGRAELEASGGIVFETLRAHADTGVDFISIGALTHSAPALDLSLILEPLP